jgi:hypothetical protein
LPTNFDRPDTYFCIGNREIGDRSPLGRIYYAAAYDVALDDITIATNASLLLINDDTPP